MRLDEAINFCYEKSKNIKMKAEPQTFIDIAEWLEELKERQQSNFDYVQLMDSRYKEGYNKAIDDFVKKIKDICANHSISTDRYDNEPIYAHEDGTWHSLIDDVVKELKVGGTDGDSSM